MRSELPNLRARLAHDLAHTLLRAKDYEGAVEKYREAMRYAPEHALPRAGLANALCRVGRWEEALEEALAALDLEPDGVDSSTFRALGLAATALGDWTRARRAWRELRLPVTGGEGPIEEDFGLGAILINRSKRPAEVWCHRIDPVRARIAVVPDPRTGHGYGDLLLYESESVGQRMRKDQSWPLFEGLLTLERSPYQTWITTLKAPSADDLAQLAARLSVSCVVLDDWTPPAPFSIPYKPWVPSRRVGIAARDKAFLDTLAGWRDEGPGCDFDEPQLGLGRARS